MTSKSEWRAMADAGMSAIEAAQSVGVTAKAAYHAATRGGFKFRDLRRAPEHRNRLLEMRADPVFAEKLAAGIARRWAMPVQPDCTHSHLRGMSDATRADYDMAMRKGFTKAEALALAKWGQA